MEDIWTTKRKRQVGHYLRTGHLVIISLNPDWRIRSDEIQWIVERQHHRQSNSGDGYSEWKPWGYFNTLAGAVNGCLGAQVRLLDMDVPAAAIEPLLAALAAIRENVNELLGDLRV